MMRIIAALDQAYGIASEHGIPWAGQLPSDSIFFRQTIKGHDILMARGTYQELTRPIGGHQNYVVTHHPEDLRPGFQAVTDVGYFLEHHPGLLWNIGGASLYRQTLLLADELVLTRIEHNFHCTKFFPSFEAHFTLSWESALHQENTIAFKMQRWTAIKQTKLPHP